MLNGWTLPIGEAASGRVCACSLRSRLVLKFNHQGHSRHWGYIRHKGHSIPTELEPLQAQMLGGLAVVDKAKSENVE